MENLSLFEEDVLKILKRLEYCCEKAELQNTVKITKNKCIEVAFSDIDFSVLKRTEDIYAVEKYLQRSGVAFKITGSKIIDKFPGSPINKYLPFNTDARLGIIECGNVDEVSAKIKKLIKKFQLTKPKLKIQYNASLGQFTFNDSGVVTLEGKQKDAADCLVGKDDAKVSWDEIFETFNDSVTDQDQVRGAELDSRKRAVRTAITGINSHTSPYTQSNKQLIGAKDNEYWLQYEVDKGR